VLQMLNEVSRDGRIRGADVAAALRFDVLLELLPDRGGVACIVSTDDRASLSYHALRQFIALEFPKQLRDVAPKNGRCRVSPVLPNGPEAAVCLLACVAAACCAPINHSNTEKEATEELASFKSELVLVLDGHDNAHIFAAAAALGLPVAVLAPSSTAKLTSCSSLAVTASRLTSSVLPHVSLDASQLLKPASTTPRSYGRRHPSWHYEPQAQINC